MVKGEEEQTICGREEGDAMMKIRVPTIRTEEGEKMEGREAL